MRPPTAAEIATAATLTGDPIALNNRSVRGSRPPRPGKRPRGRPRKDGQPPHQSANSQEHAAAAAAVYAATATPEQIAATVGTPQNLEERQKSAAANGNTTPPARFLADSLEERIKNLEKTCENPRARSFLIAFANLGHSQAMKAAGIGPLQLAGFKNNEDFRRLYEELRQAHDAATVARTCDTLAELANGDYKPKPDCLPPDMRAASLLMPALDPRFRPQGQAAAQQVQINIQI